MKHFYLNLYANAFQEETVKYREYLAGLGRTYRGDRIKKGIGPYFSKYDISNFTKIWNKKLENDVVWPKVKKLCLITKNS